MRRIAFIFALAASAAFAAGVSSARFGDIGLYDNVVTNVNLSGLIEEETDPTVPAWAKAETPPASGLSTNDVCAIVTNEVPSDGFTEWSFSGFPDGTTNISASFVNGVLEVRFNFDGVAFYGGLSGITDETSVELQCDDYYASVSYAITATRTRLTRNALGLARLADLPPLTNGLASASSVAVALGGYLLKTNGWNSVEWNNGSLVISDNSMASVTLSTDEIRIENEAEESKLSIGGAGGSASTLSVGWIGERSTVVIGVPNDSYYNGSATLTVGGTNTPSVLTVGGTNVMSRIDEVHQSIAPTVSTAISAVDTSYPRVIGITNINQTVQYVSIDSDVPSTLSIMLPTTGDTKDWIVYVTSQTNVTINLPAATWWLADTSATNDIAPQTPTALYFSQAAENIYTMGRQEFTEVVLP